MRWTWDDEKNRTNKRDHGLSFETATLVFEDELAASRPDPHPDGDRWQTVGLVGTVCLFVVHTWPEPDPETGEEIGRIISARKATTHERRAYEEGAF
ncbi:MAG: BrnT family toxin [Acetobacteraceae bacterium]